MSRDQIHIKDLLLRTIIGINPDERVKRQDVLINVTLFCELTSAGQSDNIDDTLNYKKINKAIITLVEESTFYLIEKMAFEIIKLCLQNPGVERAIVTVEKPGALRFARSVGVTLDRTRADLS